MVSIKNILGIFFVLFFMLFFLEEICALSVSPAKIELNFQPNYKNTFKYSVGGVNSERDVEISVEGELSKYVSLDKTNFKGPGEFNVNLALPKDIETPGKNRIFIIVSEKGDKELRGMIGTSIILKVAIDIFVPYPGRYLEITKFKTNNVNIGEDVIFEIDLKNKGKENLTAIPKIKIKSNDNEIDFLLMEPRYICKDKGVSLRKVLNTSNYYAGKYNASLIVDYGILISKEISFRIGELIIYVKDFTKELKISNQMEKIVIEIENGWNDHIDGVYGELIFFNNSEKITSIKTSTETLNPFEIKNIEGYVDTSLFLEGIYDVNLTLYYFGKDKGSSSSEIINIKLINKERDFISLLVFSFIILIILLTILFFLKRKFKNKKKNINK
jgi:hypothetical protein